MKFKVGEIKGLKSLRVLNAYHTLLLGLSMLPAYRGKSYEEFFEAADQSTLEEKTKMIREALLFVELQIDEVAIVLSFCIDQNGVPFDAKNMKSLGPDDVFEMLSAVFTELAKIKITMISDAEKKN